MKTGEQLISEALESFFDSNSAELIENMEKMLYEWYQHYAMDHYQIDQINEMLGGIFKVNDLILKLNDATIVLKAEQGLEANNLHSDHFDYEYAS